MMPIDRPAGPPRRPLRKDAARNRELLIISARTVFAERGLEASMDDIAAHAGLGVGTAYRHFANKYELANAIFDDAVEAFLDSAEEASTAPDAWDGLALLIEQTMIAQTGNRAIREVLVGSKPDDRERHDSMVAPLQPMFERARREGSVRADAEFADIALILVMLCAVADVAGDRSPDVWRRYLPTLLEGLRPDGPAMPQPPLAEAPHGAGGVGDDTVAGDTAADVLQPAE